MSFSWSRPAVRGWGAGNEDHEGEGLVAGAASCPSHSSSGVCVCVRAHECACVGSLRSAQPVHQLPQPRDLKRAFGLVFAFGPGRKGKEGPVREVVASGYYLLQHGWHPQLAVPTLVPLRGEWKRAEMRLAETRGWSCVVGEGGAEGDIRSMWLTCLGSLSCCPQAFSQPGAGRPWMGC